MLFRNGSLVISVITKENDYFSKSVITTLIPLCKGLTGPNKSQLPTLTSAIKVICKIITW